MSKEGDHIRGWCPGVLQPMESGDGWVVRIRPRGGRLSSGQAAGVARAARDHGNGLIDLTGRGNLQLRGVTPESHAPLTEALRPLGLIDADIGAERRRNIIVTPFADPETDALAAALEAALTISILPLPAKFGFAVDTGPAPILQDTPADIRLERDADGGLVLRADGAEYGEPLSDPAVARKQVADNRMPEHARAATTGGAGSATGWFLNRRLPNRRPPGYFHNEEKWRYAGNQAQRALMLAKWFLKQGGARHGRGRMAALIASGARPPGASVAPAPGLPSPGPGPVPQGMLIAAEFGRIEAATLAAMAETGAIRMTPWRMLLLEDASAAPDLPGLIAEPSDPRLRLRTCPGAPGCRHAHAAIHTLARQLAPHVPRDRVLHVSGCAKGCGWPRAADLTLTATPEGFDLIRDGCASDIPELRGLPPSRLPEVL